MAEQVAEVRRHLEAMGASSDAMVDALIEEAIRLAPLAYGEEQRIAREIQPEDEAAREEAKTGQASASLRVASEMSAPE